MMSLYYVMTNWLAACGVVSCIPSDTHFTIGINRNLDTARYFREVEEYITHTISSLGGHVRHLPYPDCMKLPTKEKGSCRDDIVILTHFCTNDGYQSYLEVEAHNKQSEINANGALFDVSSKTKSIGKYIILNMEVIRQPENAQNKVVENMNPEGRHEIEVMPSQDIQMRWSALKCLESSAWETSVIWDYSRVNARALTNLFYFDNVASMPHHLLLAYYPSLLSPSYTTPTHLDCSSSESPVFPDCNGSVDVLLLGWASPRRLHILQQLAEYGLNVQVIILLYMILTIL